MNALVKAFGLTVRINREAHGWSQEQLAEHAELNRSYVGDLELAKAVPSLVTVEKLATAFHVSPSHLVNEAEKRTQSEKPYPIKLTAIAC